MQKIATPEDITLYERLKENESIFAKLVDHCDGNVVIVGNGPQAVGRHRGAEIDEAGCVVRFNSFSTQFPHSHDYGTKTDVWVRMIPHPYVRFEPNTRKLQQVMLTGANRLERNYNNWQWVRAHIDRLPGLSFTPSRPFIELAQKLEAIPTSGLLLAYMLYNEIGPLSRDQVFGCSFAEKELDEEGPYHYSDSLSQHSGRHAIRREWEFFQTLLRNDDIDYYTPLTSFKNSITELAVSASPSTTPFENLASNDGTPKKWSVKEFVSEREEILTTSKGLVDYNVSGSPLKFLTRSKEQKLSSDSNALVIGFGLRGTGQKARRIQEKTGVDIALAEYGLISAYAIPSQADFKFSLMLDDIGIFFDTTNPSRTEQLIFEGETDPVLRWRASKFAEKIVQHNVIKYNDAPNVFFDQGQGKRRILVIDQTSGDLSIKLGQCEQYSFEDMLNYAMMQPATHVFLKLHPETVQGVKGGNYDLERLQNIPNLTLITESCNSMHLIKQMDEVYVMTSGMGLEALMAGKPVTCFGVPFYSGWGLTNDMQTILNDRTPRTLEDIVSAVFFRQTLWFDPLTRMETTPEDCLDRVIDMLGSGHAI